MSSDRDSIATLLYLSEWRGLTVSFSLRRVLLKHRNISGFLLSIVTGKNFGKGKGSVEAAMPSVASVTRTRARCRIRSTLRFVDGHYLPKVVDDSCSCLSYADGWATRCKYMHRLTCQWRRASFQKTLPHSPKPHIIGNDGSFHLKVSGNHRSATACDTDIEPGAYARHRRP
jgi:hypothetical protein